MRFNALTIDPLPLDAELTDAATVGPELARIANAYCSTPRALVWRNASSDWPLLLITLPLVTRLSMMTNPILGRLVREWGAGLRFIGVDADRHAHDFRQILGARALSRLVDALAHLINAQGVDSGEARASTGNGREARDRALDTVFALLANEMMTILDARRDDWPRHLAREGRLVADTHAQEQSPGMRSLFERRSRYPEFTAALHQALRDAMIDIEFYGRVLRASDARETAIEQRVLTIVESALDPIVLAKLSRSRIGAHLGCYNWLVRDPRVAAHRASVLHKLPAFGQFFADRLVGPVSETSEALLRGIVTRPRGGDDEARALRELARAIDSGQDRWTIESISHYFRVAENVVRALWRQCPAALGAPPEWHLRQILLVLGERAERNWPSDEAGWSALKASAIPASVAAA